jgi:hypothetical protein
MKSRAAPLADGHSGTANSPSSRQIPSAQNRCCPAVLKKKKRRSPFDERHFPPAA